MRAQNCPCRPTRAPDVQASGSVTTGKDGKKTDTRELYVTVENANGGVTIKCKPDDGERVREFAQRIRVAGPGAAAAASLRQRNTADAERTLVQTKADRTEVEAAERALSPEAIAKTRRRARWAWVKWAGAAAIVLVGVAAAFGGSSEAPSTQASAKTTSSAASATTATPTADEATTSSAADAAPRCGCTS
jgi:hypothetical protein